MLNRKINLKIGEMPHKDVFSVACHNYDNRLYNLIDLYFLVKIINNYK